MSEPGDVIERMARAIWLLETVEGWDDGSGIEKRMNIHTGLLCTAADYEGIARACHPIAFDAGLASCVERVGKLEEEELRTVSKVLSVSAAEYVPAIGDAFTIIDRALLRES